MCNNIVGPEFDGQDGYEYEYEYEDEYEDEYEFIGARQAWVETYVSGKAREYERSLLWEMC